MDMMSTPCCRQIQNQRLQQRQRARHATPRARRAGRGAAGRGAHCVTEARQGGDYLTSN
jgi:hypothetical protein